MLSLYETHPRFTRDAYQKVQNWDNRPKNELDESYQYLSRYRNENGEYSVHLGGCGSTYVESEGGLKALPVAVLEVFYQSNEDPGPPRRLLELKTTYDGKGNLTGVLHNQFRVNQFSPDHRKIYATTYTVDETEASWVHVTEITRYIPQKNTSPTALPLYAGLRERDIVTERMKDNVLPDAADWLTTYGMLVTGEDLGGSSLTADYLDKRLLSPVYPRRNEMHT